MVAAAHHEAALEEADARRLANYVELHLWVFSERADKIERLIATNSLAEVRPLLRALHEYFDQFLNKQEVLQDDSVKKACVIERLHSFDNTVKTVSGDVRSILQDAESILKYNAGEIAQISTEQLALELPLPSAHKPSRAAGWHTPGEDDHIVFEIVESTIAGLEAPEKYTLSPNEHERDIVLSSFIKMQLDAAAKLLLDDMPKIPSDSPQYKASLIDSFHRLSIAYENMKARTKMQPHLLRNPDAQLSQFRELLRVYRDTVRIQRYSDTRAA